MEEITLHNVDHNNFDEVVAALAWYEGLSEADRYLAVDSITFEQWDIVHQMVAGSILYIGAWPEQTDIDVNVLHHLAALMTARSDAEGMI